jgi:prevent-host-death family protein
MDPGAAKVGPRWQLQEAKQRFSELIRSAQTDGPQFVTKHGQEVAVLINIDEYRRLRGGTRDLKEYLLSGPRFDDLEITRSAERARVVDFDLDR